MAVAAEPLWDGNSTSDRSARGPRRSVFGVALLLRRGGPGAILQGIIGPRPVLLLEFIEERCLPLRLGRPVTMYAVLAALPFLGLRVPSCKEVWEAGSVRVLGEARRPSAIALSFTLRVGSVARLTFFAFALTLRVPLPLGCSAEFR